MSDTQTERPVRMKYYALKRLKVGNGYREPGDEVPEAAGWRNIQAYLNKFMIQAVPVSNEGVEGGVDLSQQAGRTESPRPAHKAGTPAQASTEGQPEISKAADLGKLTGAQLEAGVKEGSLEPGEVERHETSREKPRKGVLRALGWEDHEIEQGYRDEDTPFEPEAVPADKPFDQWTDEELEQAWVERYGDEETPPDDREGLIEDLEAPEEEDEQ